MLTLQSMIILGFNHPVYKLGGIVYMFKVNDNPRLRQSKALTTSNVADILQTTLQVHLFMYIYINTYLYIYVSEAMLI